MLFSYNWLQSFFDKKLPDPVKLAELLTLRSFEIESIKEEGKDTLLDIAVLSNRAADCLSHIGMAQECAAILGLKLNVKTKQAKKPAKVAAARTLVSVRVADKAACPRYSAKAVCGITVKESPLWIKERLIACGLRPINNVVDVTNYVMLEMGQPMHAFDVEKIANQPGKPSKIKTIIVRQAEGGERIKSLDDNVYKLTGDDLVIADAAGPLAIAGIKGGMRAQIASETKNIVLEAANFNARTVRLTSRRLGLRTDASNRFEHGLDPNMTSVALERAASLVAEAAGGTILAGVVDVYPNKTRPFNLVFNIESAEKILGTTIQAAQAKKILEALGCSVKKGAGANFDVTVPTRRTDIRLPEDLVEEVGRINGYEKIVPDFPVTQLIPPKKSYARIWRGVARQALKELGFFETYNYSFISRKDCQAFGIAAEPLLEVENPITVDFQYLRPNLTCNLVKRFGRRVPGPRDNYFELGAVFSKTVRNEPIMMAAVLSGESFFKAKAAVELVAKRLGIRGLKFEMNGESDTVYHSARCARIMIARRQVGTIGQLAVPLLNAFGVRGQLTAFELDLDKFTGDATERIEYRPAFTFPPAIRDLAVLVPRLTPAGDVIDAIRKAAGTILDEIKIFDVYEGREIPQGFKNMAFTLSYRAKNRTLTNVDVDDVHGRVIKALESHENWQTRKVKN